ncbi:MAG: type IV pilus modification protein PilV [Gammaproteobacteria bacterium]
MSQLRQKRQMRGFTLIETLVAMVVLAVGMLGIAALYIEGLRSGQASVARTTAVNLAADMADRIRANPNVPATYQGVGPGANNGCVNGLIACTPIEIAQEDWFWWLQDVQNRLPVGATAGVVANVAVAAPAVQYDVVLTWPESGQLVANAYQLRFSF